MIGINYLYINTERLVGVANYMREEKRPRAEIRVIYISKTCILHTYNNIVMYFHVDISMEAHVYNMLDIGSS